ncbi:hypothetical protein AbraIFM66951_009357, partial [Aspergillus brasiliensis]
TSPGRKFYQSSPISQMDMGLTKAGNNNATYIRYWKTNEACYTPLTWGRIECGYSSASAFRLLQFAVGYSVLLGQGLDMPY